MSSCRFNFEADKAACVTLPRIKEKKEVTKWKCLGPGVIADNQPNGDSTKENGVQRVYGNVFTGEVSLGESEQQIPQNQFSPKARKFSHLPHLEVLRTFNRLSKTLLHLYDQNLQDNSSLLPLKSRYELVQQEHFKDVEELSRKLATRLQKYQVEYNQIMESTAKSPTDCKELMRLKTCHENLFKTCIGNFDRDVIDTLCVEAIRIQTETARSGPSVRKSQSFSEPTKTFTRTVNEMRSMRAPGPRQTAKPLKPIGDTIAFHITPQQIGFTMVKTSDLKPRKMMYKHASLLLLDNNEWIFGQKQPKEDKSRYWELSSFLASDSHTASKQDEMKLEYILGVMLCIAKRLSLFDGDAVNACDAVIAIPTWFTSYRRQQIVDAAEIAGFSKTTLINETSASSYYLFYTGIVPIENELVVISKNENEIEMVLYVFDKVNKCVLALTRCGSQEKTAIKLYLEKTKDSRLTLQYKDKNDDISKVLMALLSIMWNIMIERADKPISKLSSSKRSALICSDSEDFLKIFKHTAKTICGARHVLIEKESVAKGLFSICKSSRFQNTFSANGIMQDFIPFKLMYSSSVEKGSNKMEVSLKQYNERIFIEMPGASDTFRNIQQINRFESESSIGSFSFHGKFENLIKCILYFEQTYDGILNFEGAACEVNEGKKKNVSRYELSPSFYKWKSVGLSASDKQMYKHLVENLKYTQFEMKVEKSRKLGFLTIPFKR